jgi:cytochrome b561
MPSLPRRYDAIAIFLHWVTALAVIGLIAIGFVMTRLSAGSHMQFMLFQLHKSIGITVLVLSVVRLGWRVTHPTLPLPIAMPHWERVAARLSHAFFYGLLLGLPLLGWATVSASPLKIPTMLYGVLPWPDLPLVSDLSGHGRLAERLGAVHGFGGLFMGGLLIVHVAAALRHHLIMKDTVLLRMLPLLKPVAGPTQ